MRQQIEKMAKVLCPDYPQKCHICGAYRNDGGRDCYVLEKSERLYDAGCRLYATGGIVQGFDLVGEHDFVVPKNVTFPKVDVEKMDAIDILCEKKDGDTIFKATIDFEKWYKKECESNGKLIREETAKEILQKLKAKIWQCKGCYMPDCFESPTNDFAFAEDEVKKVFDELAKEYGIEVDDE